jgi:hypothetical protein
VLLVVFYAVGVVKAVETARALVVTGLRVASAGNACVLSPDCALMIAIRIIHFFRREAGNHAILMVRLAIFVLATVASRLGIWGEKFFRAIVCLVAFARGDAADDLGFQCAVAFIFRMMGRIPACLAFSGKAAERICRLARVAAISE